MMTQDFKSDITRRFTGKWRLIWAVLAIALLLSPPAGHAQTFESGSDGSDGALSLTRPDPDPSPGEPFVIEFDPGALGLDADGDHIFHFTTITIAEGVIVRLSARQISAPVVWLASGAVQIDGIINVNGENGQGGQDLINESRRFAVPGAGGFAGGLGSTVNLAATPGFGPGRGGAASSFGFSGGGGGHAVPGRAGGVGNHGVGGSAYGNDFLVPLVGGSGGGGGTRSGSGIGGSGGAGGGALLIASSASIAIIGNIVANGGSGGFAFTSGGSGGGGSGGAIHLLAPTINVAGALRALGGSNTSSGRIRVEAFQRTITGSVNPLPVNATPFAVFLPPRASLRVVSVDGVPVPSDSTGSFTMPDVTINNVSPVPVVIEARNIPVGTVVQLHLLSDAGVIQIVDSPPLAGTDALSTATASVTFPSGFSRGFVRATFGPPSP